MGGLVLVANPGNVESISARMWLRDCLDDGPITEPFQGVIDIWLNRTPRPSLETTTNHRVVVQGQVPTMRQVDKLLDLHVVYWIVLLRAAIYEVVGDGCRLVGHVGALRSSTVRYVVDAGSGNGGAPTWFVA